MSKFDEKLNSFSKKSSVRLVRSDSMVGPKGDAGPQGPRGFKGEKGDKGDAGKDAHMIGQKGEKGDQGDMGPPGRPGKDARDGLNGKNGKDGKDGKDGRDAHVIDIIEFTKPIEKKLADGMARIDGRIKLIDQRWHGGGITSSSENTLTNKRITKRTQASLSSATPSINTDNVDMYLLTAQAAHIISFTTSLSGTPTEGQTLWIVITGTGTYNITWGSAFESSTVTLPTTSAISTQRYDFAFVWNDVTKKWRLIATA